MQPKFSKTSLPSQPLPARHSRFRFNRLLPKKLIFWSEVGESGYFTGATNLSNFAPLAKGL